MLKKKENGYFFIKFANEGVSAIKEKIIEHEGNLKIELQPYSETPEGILLKVRTILDEIIMHKEISDSVNVRFFVEICEASPSESLILKKLNFSEPRRLYPLIWTMNPQWVKDLAFSLIGYLSNPETDLEKIHRCAYCNQYFISIRSNKRIRYCPDCSRKNKRTREQRTLDQQEYRRKKKEAEIAIKNRKREMTIQGYMKSLDISRKEAKNLWRDEYED